MAILRFLQRQCQSCGEHTFSYLDLFKLVDGRVIKCKKCRNKYVSKGFWLLVFQILVGLFPLTYVLTIMFAGFLTGTILFVVGFILITWFITFFIPIRKVEIKVKTEVIDNLQK